MKDQYVTPEAEIIILECEDIMTASNQRESWELDIQPDGDSSKSSF